VGGGQVRKKSQVLLIAGRCLVNLLCQKWHLDPPPPKHKHKHSVLNELPFPHTNNPPPHPLTSK
jgi:hypothetical protein